MTPESALPALAGGQASAILESIPCGIGVYRYDGSKIVPVLHNSIFYEVMGYSKQQIQEVERETNFLGVHPQDLAPLRQKVKQVLQCNGVLQETYRVWNSEKQEYRWISLNGSVKPQEDGTRLIYGVYSDVSEQKRMQNELISTNEKMQDIINAIPGGVAVYKVSDIFETVYFSDGVPALSGYSIDEYRELVKHDAANLIYPEDTAMVVGNLRRALREHTVADFEFRKQHKSGCIVWVHIQARQLGSDDGTPLLHCVFHNISVLKETQLELDHLINSIPGGIASYQIEGGRMIPTFFSEGVLALSGHTRDEIEELVRDDALNIVYEADRGRVTAALKAALESGDALEVSYRMRHKDGHLIWIRLNGRRMGPLSASMKFYAVFTGISAETQLFRSIANESADGIYVINRESYDLLYANERKDLFQNGSEYVGQKCYAALHGRSSPCEFCTLKSHAPDGTEHDMAIGRTGRFYSTRFRETDWNGIPAYVKYVQDITEKVKALREKARLEQYFQTLVKYLSGGVAVVRYEEDGSLIPEFLSDGFATMTGMTLEEAWRLYQQDAMAGVHPDDHHFVNQQMASFVSEGAGSCEIVYRLKKGDGSYVWVKNTLSMIRTEDGERRVYASYHDMTREREEKEQLRQQYNELILQHHRKTGPNVLVAGHCNVTKDEILEITDYTNSNLLQAFGTVRNAFFTGIAGLVVDEAERQAFLNTYLNAPSLAAFESGTTELILDCFIQLPQESRGRYVQFDVHLVETPDTGDVTGILMVTDITEKTVSDRILHRLSSASYDLVVDIDLPRDSCTVLSAALDAGDLPPTNGRHSQHVAYMLQKQVVPRDREQVSKMLDPDYMVGRLRQEATYSFSYSIVGEKGDILTKKLTISAIDLRLGRICLARADITDSVREQQGLLNVVAYTFELLGMIHVGSRRFTLYTRQTVLQALPPLVVENYDLSVEYFSKSYIPDGGPKEVKRRFCLEEMLQGLEEKPSGYDFVLPCQSDEGLRYKQINVLWGDENHSTVCWVRADVTDMLAAERQTKEALEGALTLAKEANRAKSDFLSSMSHDIRTPMNAIMGMTALAVAHLGDRERVGECLQKISLSSRHLLSLINDILDMSKIERSKITLNHTKVSLFDLAESLSAMMEPQAKAAGLQLDLQIAQVAHPYFYGDSLRINQILINLISNAVKFTPEGGRVRFMAEEVPSQKAPPYVCYRFTVSDTGIGMSEDFLAHLFEPFMRNRNAAQVEGTGLGLSITKGLVDLMGGRISVKSREHCGTTFQVELECEAAPDGEGIETRVQPELASRANEGMIDGRCFLVAEDNMINAEILCELLQMYGARCVVKTNGAQAVQEFQAAGPGTYDAILMDIQMPEMNGYEATRAIRAMDRADALRIPIVAMTANAFTEDIQASADAGMTAHVAKPVDMQLLLNTLCGLLESKNPL